MRCNEGVFKSSSMKDLNLKKLIKFKRAHQEKGVAMVFVLALSATLMLMAAGALTAISNDTHRLKKYSDKMWMRRIAFSVLEQTRHFYIGTSPNVVPTSGDYFDLFYPVTSEHPTFGGAVVYDSPLNSRFTYTMHNRITATGQAAGVITVKNEDDEFVKLDYRVNYYDVNDLSTLALTNMSGTAINSFPGVNIAHQLMGKTVHASPPVNLLDHTSTGGASWAPPAAASIPDFTISVNDPDKLMTPIVTTIASDGFAADPEGTDYYDTEEDVYYPADNQNESWSDGFGGPPLIAAGTMGGALGIENPYDGGTSMPVVQEITIEPLAVQTAMSRAAETRRRTYERFWEMIELLRANCPPGPFDSTFGQPANVFIFNQSTNPNNFALPSWGGDVWVPHNPYAITLVLNSVMIVPRSPVGSPYSVNITLDAPTYAMPKFIQIVSGTTSWVTGAGSTFTISGIVGGANVGYTLVEGTFSLIADAADPPGSGYPGNDLIGLPAYFGMPSFQFNWYGPVNVVHQAGYPTPNFNTGTGMVVANAPFFHMAAPTNLALITRLINFPPNIPPCNLVPGIVDPPPLARRGGNTGRYGLRLFTHRIRSDIY